MMYIIDWCGFLQIYRNNSLSLGTWYHFIVEESFFSNFFPADLTPATWGSAKIDNAFCIFKDMEDVLDL